MARSLLAGTDTADGFVVDSIADPFFAKCAEAAGAVARSHDCLLIVAVSGNQVGAERSSIEVLMRHRPDGLLIVPANSQNRALAEFLQELPVPAVTFDRPLRASGCASVLTDNLVSARTAVEHLIAHGHKRILCCGGEPDLYTIRERVAGYRVAMEEASLPCLLDTAACEDQAAAETLLRRHLGGPDAPEALFTLKNSATVAVFEALQAMRVRVPQKLALLGFDDFELAGTLRPALSVVQQPIEAVARRAAELLMAEIDKPATAAKPAAKRPLVLASTLVVRASCGCR